MAANTRRSISRYLRISLRLSLILMLLFGLAFGWVGMKRRQSQRQREAVASIMEVANRGLLIGGMSWPHRFGDRRECRHWERHSRQPSLVFDSGPFGERQPRGRYMPELLRRVTGEECFHKVIAVDLAGHRADGEHLAQLATFQDLEALNLDAVHLDPDDLKQIGKLRRLKWLCLGEGEITDAGMLHLARLTQLQELELWHNPISDKGLHALTQLKRLKRLNLCFTQVTSYGIHQLQQAIPDCQIWWNGCETFRLIGERSLSEPNPSEIVRVVNHLHSLGREEAVVALSEYTRLYEDEWLSYVVPLLFPRTSRQSPPPQPGPHKNSAWPDSYSANQLQGEIPFYTGGYLRNRPHPVAITPRVINWVGEHCELRKRPLQPAGDPLNEARILYERNAGEFNAERKRDHFALGRYLRKQAERMVAHLNLRVSSRAKLRWSDERQEYVVAGE